MARDALSKEQIAAGLSTYKKSKAESAAKSATKTACKLCKTEIDKFVWSKRQKRSIECTYCYPCWKKNRLSKAGRNDCPSDETSALLIGVITQATAITDVGS